MRRLAMFILILGLTGCATTRRAVMPKAPTELFLTADASTAVLRGDWLTNYHANLSRCDDMESTALERCQLLMKTHRNAILNTLRLKVDTEYRKFIADVYTGKAGFDIFGDLTQLGLTSAASTVGGEATKEILSVIATGTAGAKSSVDKRFFEEQSRAAIVAKMNALRAEASVELEVGMTQGVSDYSLENGLLDIQNYYFSGSIIAALQGISQKSGVDMQNAQKRKVEQLRRLAR